MVEALLAVGLQPIAMTHAGRGFWPGVGSQLRRGPLPHRFPRLPPSEDRVALDCDNWRQCKDGGTSCEE